MPKQFTNYYSEKSQRDIRFDFIRGMAMAFVVINHLPFPSYLYAFTVERIGVVTGAELFVILSGLVTGFIHQKYITKHGWNISAKKLVQRSIKLYLTVVLAGVFVWVFARMTSNDHILTYMNLGHTDSKQTSLFTKSSLSELSSILILQNTPSQINILGLYIVLLIMTPFLLWLLLKRKWLFFFIPSLLLYIAGFTMKIRLSDFAFENSFPLLCWQFPFTCALIIGFHYHSLANIIHKKPLKIIRACLVVLFCVFFFYTLNNYWTGNQYGHIPNHFRLAVIEPERFDFIYAKFFNLRTWLFPGRVLNAFVVVAFLCELLNVIWPWAKKFIGWYTIPVGQDSLNVFLFHLLLIAFVLPLEINGSRSSLSSTLIHLFLLLVVWFFVKVRPVIVTRKFSNIFSISSLRGSGKMPIAKHKLEPFKKRERVAE